MIYVCPGWPRDPAYAQQTRDGFTTILYEPPHREPVVVRTDGRKPRDRVSHVMCDGCRALHNVAVPSDDAVPIEDVLSPAAQNCLSAMRDIARVDAPARSFGNAWYINVHAEIGGNRMLAGVGGHGRTPSDAVLAAWHAMTQLDPGHYVVVDAMRDTRRHYRWSGHHWREISR